jgi:hypothetical protein
MPYIIKHKTEDRYVSFSKSMKADHDENYLTSLKHAQVYPTEAGAKSAMNDWAKYGVSGLINQAKLDLVEIVPIELRSL